MSINDVIRSWKEGDNDHNGQDGPENPVGPEELNDEELAKAAGGLAQSHSWNQGDACGTSNAVGCPTGEDICV